MSTAAGGRPAWSPTSVLRYNTCLECSTKDERSCVVWYTDRGVAQILPAMVLMGKVFGEMRLNQASFQDGWDNHYRNH